MAKHRDAVIWGLRWPPGVWSADKKYRPNGLVRTSDTANLKIELEGIEDWDFDADQLELTLDRKTARLLADRILRCLEATK